MVEINNKLAVAYEAMKSESCSIKEVSTVLAEAGKLAADLDIELMASLGVAKECKFLSEALECFVKFEAKGVFGGSEAMIADAICECKSLIEITEKFQQTLSVDFEFSKKISARK